MAEWNLPRRALLLVLLSLAGCATQADRGKQSLNALVALLPGSYDNLAQSRTAPDHVALRLMIAPVQAPLVGDHVFYVQEMAADDLRRVLTQRLYVVDSIPDSEKSVLTQMDFNEPARWRDGYQNRELFRGLLLQDLRKRAGCDLIWTSTEKGFSAAGDPQQCRVAARGTGETLRADQKLELDRDGIAVFDQHRDASGAVVYGGETDPWYRFSRRVDAPW
jgi:CpeT/CpcT family (DUF1001)